LTGPEEITMPSGNSRSKAGANGTPRQPPLPRPGWFDAFAQTASRFAGKPATFLGAVTVILIWALSGPFFGFSETWQLVINTTTTIITFLMVFLIQNTQTRDTLALQVKLAELILHMPGAPNRLADAEDMSEKQLDRLHAHYKATARGRARKSGRRKSGG
jgi:low affinity Fe/Cu permease